MFSRGLLARQFNKVFIIFIGHYWDLDRGNLHGAASADSGQGEGYKDLEHIKSFTEL